MPKTNYSYVLSNGTKVTEEKMNDQQFVSDVAWWIAQRDTRNFDYGTDEGLTGAVGDWLQQGDFSKPRSLKSLVDEWNSD